MYLRNQNRKPFNKGGELAMEKSLTSWDMTGKRIWTEEVSASYVGLGGRGITSL